MIPNMTNSVLHKSNTRGHADHGWLNAHHTFSFANYYNPDRIHFGALRVLNDDVIAGGMGFGTHPHDNMEIITIPLEGDLAHKDSMGNSEVIHAGEIQVMSAGSGITHSEYNSNPDRAVSLLQIWVFPNKRNVTPRYDQKRFTESERKNKLQQVVSPDTSKEGLWIHQDAWFFLGKFDNGIQTEHAMKRNSNGAYFFIIQGKAEINGQTLEKRDGFGVWNCNKVKITSLEDNTEILLMDVPMIF